MNNENRMSVLPGNKVYEAAVRRETKAWGSSFALRERRSIEYSYPAITAYRNRIITGSSETTWIDFLKGQYGRFGRALSLGVGTGWIEEALLKQGLVSVIDISDLSHSAVEYVSNRLSALDSRVKVNAHVQDANFIRLEPESYDLIICHSILHHVINLEYLLYHLNLSLKKTGMLVVDEFIGPSRFQWPKQVCDVVNSILRSLTLGKAFRPLVLPELAVMAMSSPFESIRSSELGPLLEVQFQENIILEQRFMGFLYPAIWTLDFSDWEDAGLQKIVEECIELDMNFTKAGLLPPSFLFGIYEKSRRQMPTVSPFKDYKIRRLLDPIWNASPLRLAKWIAGSLLGRSLPSKVV
jgi:SAM-dependent methyltransferase